MPDLLTAKIPRDRNKRLCSVGSNADINIVLRFATLSAAIDLSVNYQDAEMAVFKRVLVSWTFIAETC